MASFAQHLPDGHPILQDGLEFRRYHERLEQQNVSVIRQIIPTTAFENNNISEKGNEELFRME